jgi:Flp pilus assembly secretin CpaC
MRRPIQTLVLACAVLGAGAAMAAAPAPGAPGAVSVALHESRRIMLPGVAATVTVGDPSVADVAVPDTHSLILIGRGFGVTELMVTDKAGRILLHDEVSVVSANDGRVTLYRGLAASEFACAGGRCQPIGPPTGAQPAAPPPGGN